MLNFFKNQNVFYDMVLSSTIMSNCHTDELKNDALQIINFIGRAYDLPKEFITACCDVILGELSALNLTSEQKAIFSNRGNSVDFAAADILLDFKSDVLSDLQQLSENKNINPNWFDYKHYKTYQPDIRFAQINTAGSYGNPIATRQIGILYSLGIGCKKNLDFAIKRFTQCAYWGNISAIYYLAYTYKLTGDNIKSKCFYEVADIASKYLYVGCTVLPDDVKNNYSPEAVELYVYISSIKLDVINAGALNNIDFSFIEAITSDCLDYYKRMKYINEYSTKAWKEVTNSSNKPINIGF